MSTLKLQFIRKSQKQKF